MMNRSCPKIKLSAEVEFFENGSANHKIIEKTIIWKMNLIVAASNNQNFLWRLRIDSTKDEIVHNDSCSVHVVH